MKMQSRFDLNNRPNFKTLHKTQIQKKEHIEISNLFTQNYIEIRLTNEPSPRIEKQK